MSSKPNVLILGAGAIGSVYASILLLSRKCSVYIVARSNYDVLKEKGLRLTSSKFGNHDELFFSGVYKTCEEAASLSGVEFDYIVCSTKALLDVTPSLSTTIRPTMSKSTSIVLLQNGVGAEEPLHQAFPGATVISAVVWTGGKILSPGHVEQFNREALTIGIDRVPSSSSSADAPTPEDPEQSRLDVLVDLLRAGGGECNVVDDIQSERWVKVIWNACWNAVTTVTQLRTNRFLSSSPYALQLSRSIMSEVVLVARTKGLHVPDGTIDRLIDQCTSVKEGLPSSMLFDYLAGRPMEVEVILGTPLKEGTRLGLDLPSLTALYSIVKALDWKNAHPEEAKI